MKERFWLNPLAFLLGVFSWFYVNIISTTPITREYKVKISYLNKDDSKNYKVIPESPEVKVRVKGPRGVFIQTKVEDNTFASVDLINCHGGKLTLPVNVIFPSTSMKHTPSFPQYTYRFSPPLIPMGSADIHLPVSAS